MSDRSRYPYTLILEGAGIVFIIRLLPFLVKSIFALLRSLLSIITSVLKLLSKFALPVATLFLFRWLLKPKKEDVITVQNNSGRAIQAARGYAAIFDIPTEPYRRNPPKPTDLKIITGINLEISRILNEGGIRTFQDLAVSKSEDLSRILEVAGMSSVSNLDTWSHQARLASAGDWEGLRSYQEQLKTGSAD